MRTTIDIDEKLLADAMRILNVSTKSEAVRIALERFLRAHAFEEILKLRGKLEWTDDCAASHATSKTKTLDDLVGSLPTPTGQISLDELCAPVGEPIKSK